MVGAIYKDNQGATQPPMNTVLNPAEFDETVWLKNKYTVPAFGTLVVHGRKVKMMMMNQSIWVLMQAPYLENGANLPTGPYVIGTYTKLEQRTLNNGFT